MKRAVPRSWVDSALGCGTCREQRRKTNDYESVLFHNKKIVEKRSIEEMSMLTASPAAGAATATVRTTTATASAATAIGAS